MLKITTPYGYLKFRPDIEIPITITNPLFNDRGSYSLPFSVPEKPNREALGFPASVSSKTAVGEFIDCVIEHGIFKEKGTLKITDVSSDVELTLTTREGAFWEWAKKTKLRDIQTLPGKNIDFLAERENYFNNIWPNVEMAFFPIATKLQGEEAYTNQTYWNGFCSRKLGVSDYILWNNPNDLFRTDYGTDSSGYITGFLYINEIIQWIAKTYGFKVGSNYLSSTNELKSAVVLNKNINKGIFGGPDVINYSYLLPDVTVMEFIDAIEKSFGCVFLSNSNRREFSIKSINQIIDVTNSQSIKGTISISKFFNSKGFNISASKSSSPYIKVDERAIDNFFFSYTEENESRVDGKIYQTASTPDYINYPNKVVLCKASQAYFYLYWEENSENTWDYKSKCIHSNYYDLNNNDNLDQNKVEIKAEFVPMVPTTLRQFYENSGNAYFDIPLLLPHFENWDSIFGFSDGILSEDTTKTPITFAFYRGRIQQLIFPVTLFGINSFNMPFGTVDVYDKSGSLISNANYGFRIVGSKGVYENCYKNLEQLYLKSFVEVNIDNLNISEVLSRDLNAPCNVKGTNFLFNEIKLTLKAHNIEFDSATGYTLKPFT